MDALSQIGMQLREHGYARRSEAVAAGVADSTFSDLARRLKLKRHYCGILVPDPASLSAVASAAAALRAVGEPALLTGAAGLDLLGLAEVQVDAVDVVVPLRRSPVARDGLRVHHTSTYSDIRFQHAHGLPVARPERCLADLAPHVTYKNLARLIANADRQRLVTINSLQEELARRKRFPGRALLRRVIADMREETTHSKPERLGRRLLVAAGHNPHSRPLTILDGPRVLAEADIPFERIKYDVEIDGPHHLLMHVAAADRIRDRALERIGWVVDRFFWFELDERPQWFVAEVARRIAQRTAPP